MTTELTTAVDLAARVLGPLGSRDEPLGPMTTYKVGGTAALFVRARTVDDLLTVAAARRASGLPVLVVGRGSNLLVADEGFAGIGVSIAEFAAAIEIDGTACVAGNAMHGDRRRWGGAARRRPANGRGRADRVRVGGRSPRLDRRGGADERRRARLGHGRLRRRCGRGRPRRPGARRRAMGCRRPRFALPRFGPRRPPRRGLGAPAARARRPRGLRGDDRRHRALAARAPAGRAELRLGVRQPRAR